MESSGRINILVLTTCDVQLTTIFIRRGSRVVEWGGLESR